MNTLDSVLAGFATAVEPANLMFCLIGVTIGMFIGVLPGLGPSATIAILLPVTYSIEPTGAIIMLAGIFYGAIYGGTITSVLLRLPGEASSVVVTFDGYPMAQKGRAGVALTLAAVASFIGGTVSLIFLTVLAPVVARFAVDFGPPEFAVLTLVGIGLVSSVGSSSVPKSLAAAALGLLFATVGRDELTGDARFTFGTLTLIDGFGFVLIAMGVFGIAEIIHNQEAAGTTAARKPIPITQLRPTTSEVRQAVPAVARGGALGFMLGLLPGGGATLSSLVSYAVEKGVARDKSRFGHGAVEGVAGPETANNAAASSSFIPLLTLGLPANPAMAMLFGAFLVVGITPGPNLVDTDPDLFWGIINSMYVGNILLLIMAIPLVGVFVRVLSVNPAYLAAICVMVTVLGVFSLRQSPTDIVFLAFFGALGYLMKKTGISPGPMVLAFILGGILEPAFRQSMRIFAGDPTGFLTRPISGTLLVVAVLGFLGMLGFRMWRKRTGRAPLVAAAENTASETHRP